MMKRFIIGLVIAGIMIVGGLALGIKADNTKTVTSQVDDTLSITKKYAETIPTMMNMDFTLML